MGTGGSVVARLVELTWTRLVEMGCAEAVLRQRVSFEPPRERLAPLHRRVPYAHLCELVAAGAELTGDPALGLRLSLPMDPRTGGLLVLVMLACDDVEHALRRLVRYQRVAFDAYRVELDGGTMRVSFPDPAHPAVPHLASWFVEDTLRGIGTLAGTRPVPITVGLPGDPAPRLERAFGCGVRGGETGVTIAFDQATLRSPLRHTNGLFRAALEHEVEGLLARLPRGRRWADAVRAALIEELPHGPTLTTVAARLGLAPRTLQRRLDAEGTTVAALLEALRRERAVELLRREVDIGEIAYRLGYASPSSFHRAFRRWFDTTPAKFPHG
ncbi:MAG: hypothetical protein CMN30_03575 [Sandaracinus sp.]|nr:hypothetical protein [Sandaracinus sp.]|tara:strand:- start:48 stop:1031 length:984 start_codon:yes stop_codon:yes gene_type:complete